MQTASSVVINEVLLTSGEAGFVEFYNPLNEAIELRNHYLSDTSGQLDKYLIKEERWFQPKRRRCSSFRRSDWSLVPT